MAGEQYNPVMLDWSVVMVSRPLRCMLTLSAADQRGKPPLFPMISNTPSLRHQYDPEIQTIPAKRTVVTPRNVRLG